MSMPCSSVTGLSAAGLFFAAWLSTGAAGAQRNCLHFIDGRWFNDRSFVRMDFYSKGGTLTHAPCSEPLKIDLNGGYVVPPYGDAHEHNFDNVSSAHAQSELYLRDGIFYAQGMTDVSSGADAVKQAKMVNTPSSVDVTYAHGGITGFNGHPKEVYESLPLGFYFPVTPEQRDKVIQASSRAGLAYWETETPRDLERVWPRILASHPDLIKVYLVTSEEWKPRSSADARLGLGLNPALVSLVSLVVKKAHAAGIKVAAHVDTAADAAIAIRGGVDELGHLPGYGLTATDDLSRVRLSDELIRRQSDRA